MNFSDLILLLQHINAFKCIINENHSMIGFKGNNIKNIDFFFNTAERWAVNSAFSICEIFSQEAFYYSAKTVYTRVSGWRHEVTKVILKSVKRKKAHNEA